MSDIEKIRSNCSVLLQKKYLNFQEAQRFFAEQNKDGSWQDIDYYCTNKSGWRTAQHLRRLRALSALWSSKQSPLFHSEELGNSIKRGIEFWCRENRQSTNWWWNEIFVPMTFGHIFIMSYDLLQDGPWLDAAMPYFKQAELKYNGQNRIWVAKGVLFRGLLTSDKKAVTAAHKAMLSEIAYGKRAGICVDGSFHQHGPQLQFGNYGLSYLENITTLICYFSGTRFALTEISPFRDFVLNGMKWVLWKDVMDISAQGRQIWKNTQTAKCRVIYDSFKMLSANDPEFAAEYTKAPVGNKMFFRSDYMVHRTPAFYASFRANSQKVRPVETYVISDNQLGRYLSDGLLQVMRTGKEYLNIAGCWEWNRLPGTTLPATPLVEKMPDGSSRAVIFKPTRVEGESAFTGGVSDGAKYGAMIYVMTLDKVKANKAVFFAGDVIIALGSGICSGSPYPVATTVEQSLLCGKVEKGKDFFYHNGIGYSGKNLVLFAGKRKGDWQPLWGAYKTPEPDEKEIFQLTIEHGKSIRNGSYEYAIYPNTALEDMPEAKKSYQVLENSDILQAVRLKDNTVMAVFHKPGKLEGFSTDSAGVFIIKEKQILAADPTQKKRVFNLTRNDTVYKVKLPGGKFAGSTVVTGLQ